MAESGQTKPGDSSTFKSPQQYDKKYPNETGPRGNPNRDTPRQHRDRSRSGDRHEHRDSGHRSSSGGRKEGYRGHGSQGSNDGSHHNYNRSPSGGPGQYGPHRSAGPSHGPAFIGPHPQSPDWQQYGPGWNNQQYSPQSPDGQQQWFRRKNQSWDGQTTPQQRGRHSRGQDDDPDVYLSKTLSSILRHNADRFGFKLMKGGFLYVDEILKHMKNLRRYQVDDVLRVVASNDKKRFTVEMEGARYKIRANQGHSLEVTDLDLKPITTADEVPNVIHGTYFEAWNSIKKTGLRRMKRNHIHFAAGEPGQNEVISGMRTTCEVVIYIDLEKALKDGLKFFLSANNVILSPGNEDGIIYPCYFLGARDRYKGHKLEFDNTISSGQKTEVDKGKRKKNKKNKKHGKDEDGAEDKGRDWFDSDTVPTEKPAEEPDEQGSPDGPGSKRRRISDSRRYQSNQYTY